MSTKNKTEFWLSSNSGKSSFMFPVLPEKITVERDSGSESVIVSGLGEVSIIQDPSLKEYEFSSHFPAVIHQGVQATIQKKPKQLKTPMRYVELIEKWIASKKPVKFTITSPKTSLFCSIESFKYYEQGGDPDTIYFTIRLKEYREVTIRKLDKTPTKTPRTPKGGEDGSGETSADLKYGQVKTDGSRLPLYEKASTSSKVLSKLANGSFVKILSMTGNWYKVSTAAGTGITGYVKAEYIKKVSTPSGAFTPISRWPN